MAMPTLFVFYHYLYPDDVVSSIHFSELCAGLAERGWSVEGYPCNRSCREETKTYSEPERWCGVSIKRLWRPSFRQASALGRILNAVWMIFRWSALALFNKPDAILIGTDPVLSILVAPVWRLLRPKTRILHWCFDLYPEAAIADGVLKEDSLAVRALRGILVTAYQSCDAIVDIGSCMRKRLQKYASAAQFATIVPWATAEPAEPLSICHEERNAIYGEARLALMYSGNFGRAHSYEDLLELTRLLRKDGVQIAFSVRGNREKALRSAVLPEDSNVHFTDFAPAEQLERRLAAADIQVVTLRDEWAGDVVPSKFFGALAIGRPVLFCGSRESALAQWIERFKVGWVVAPGAAGAVVQALRDYLSDESQRTSMMLRCHQVYAREFSKELSLDRWNVILTELLNPLEDPTSSESRPLLTRPD